MLSKKELSYNFIALLLVIVTGIVASAQSAPMMPQAQHERPLYVPGELVVKFKSGDTSIAAQRSLRTMGLRAVEVSTRGRWVRVETTVGKEAEMIDELLARGDVEYATYNRYIYATETPNDIFFDLQWNMAADEPGGIDAVGAWNIQTGSDSVTIAVLDGGVDDRHPEFAGRIVAAEDYINDGLAPENDNYVSHATHVGGIAAASGNNDIGVSGVSWGAKIYSIKILNNVGAGTTTDFANALYEVIEADVDIVNMSFVYPGSGSPCRSEVLNPAIEAADEAGILLIAAAGNEGDNEVNCPAAYDEVIAVGSLNRDGTLQSASNFGDGLEVVAPGNRIYSTETVIADNPTYGTKSGTSFASPHVAGVAALILSVDPTLTSSQVRDIIRDTADDIGVAGFDDLFGWGRVNARRAVESLAPLQLSTTQNTLLIDDQIDPLTTTLEITSLSAENVSWSATISPTVTWLTVITPTSGTVSLNNPATLTISPTKPSSYGTYSTTVIIDYGVNARNSALTVNYRYVPQVTRTYLPLTLR